MTSLPAQPGYPASGLSRTIKVAALAALTCWCADGAWAAERLNIVFIEADDLTQKFVGAYGAENISTPAIDDLARRGALFRTAIAQGTMCAPSRNSMITGLYPRNLGLYANGTLPALPAGIWTFPLTLQRQGYHTSWVGKSHIVAPKDGIPEDTPYRNNAALQQHMGFDDAASSNGRFLVMRLARKMGGDWEHGKDAYADHLHDKGLIDQFVTEYGKPSTLPPDDYLDGYIARQAVDWIDAYDGDEPFFLWVNFSAPHGPYDAPGDWTTRYKPEDMPPLIVDRDKEDMYRPSENLLMLQGRT